MNRYIKKGAVILLWLGVWFLLALAVDNKILLATPAQTLKELWRLLFVRDFWLSVGRSLLRVALGFFSGFFCALLLAALGRAVPAVEELLAPVMRLITAIPVASFVVLLLIWWGSSFLAVAICFLVVLPHIYISMLEGLKAADRRLLETARVFRMPLLNRFFYIYRPAFKPFLLSSMKIALGMCWKSGVAAEVIGTPDHSIGERLYMSKIYLDTAGVFAWTVVVILLSVCFEKLVLLLARLFFDWEPSFKVKERSVPARTGARVENLVKGFDGQKVIDGMNAVYEPGEIYYLRSPSGSGKTTLLHMLCGLLEADAGKIERPEFVSVMFQEDRLCEEYSAVKNVELVCADKKRAGEALRELLGEEAIERPCVHLSGGMKRRVALVRAMEAESDMVLLDEPFTGMDADTKARAQEYIDRRKAGRTVIVATHI